MTGQPEQNPATVAADADPARWVVAGLREFCYDVGSVVPDSFEAFARVFPPAIRGAGAGAVRVRWAEVARANGRVMHPAAEWGSITGSWDYQYSLTQPGLWDEPPDTGELAGPVARRLAAVLAPYTGTPERCWFGLYEGRDLADRWRGAPRFEIPHREMLLLSGPITAAAVTFATPSWIRRSPNLWWPDDRAWCIGTDIDLMTTYVGASAGCVAALLADPDLEVLPVSADQRVTWDADTVNPLPRPPG